MSYTKVLHRQFQYIESGYAALGADIPPRPPSTEPGVEAVTMYLPSVVRTQGVRVGYRYAGPQLATPGGVLVSVYRWDSSVRVWQPAVIDAPVDHGYTMSVGLPGMPGMGPGHVGVLYRSAVLNPLPGVYELGMEWEPVRDGTPRVFGHTAAKAVPVGSVEAIAESTPCQSILIQAPSGNPGVVWIGADVGAGDLVADGGQLPPGSAMEIRVDNADKVFCTATEALCTLRVLVVE